MLRFLFCLVASASAYEMPLSRRAVMARVAAAVPLAAVAPAFADVRAGLKRSPSPADPSSST